MDEGYIKFKAHWTPGPPLPAEIIAELQHWRQELYQRKLIGAYPDGIGYGNISQRYPEPDQFVISGSATGNFAELGVQHYSRVTHVDWPNNTLDCTGPIIASSESMSHAVIYATCPWVGGVVHVHHLGLWEYLLTRVPATPVEATYGSPEMAAAIIHLLANTDLPQQRLFAMAGHREGIFSFGATLAEATGVLLETWQQFRAKSAG